MAEAGFVSLLIALALSIYGMIGSVVGKGIGAHQLQVSAKRTAYLVPAALLISTLALVIAFLRRDFKLEYVAGHSNLAMDPVYTWVAFYSGNEGSLLYIAFVLSLMTAAVVAFAPRTLRGSMPYTLAILMAVQAFFLGVMSIMANPFDVLPSTPPDGQGINPLLTHPGMFFHPPMLMAGLVGVSVPFALAMGMLINGSTSDDWVDTGRVWSLIIWAILGIGLLLGSWWAYTILGWGGYWAWDPIENVALMPWLVLTGFLHSIMVQKRRGLFRVWNVVLMNVAFTLALFGIFINRGGPVVSVHSFASSTLGWVFLGFLVFSLLFSFGVFFIRYGSLRSTTSLDSTLSREAAFLANNLLLLAIAFVTLWGVVFPLISEVFRGVTVTVGAPFYDRVNGPLFLVLILLMGVGPLMPWRTASWLTLRRAVQTPGLVALGTVALLLAFRVTHPFALMSYGLCAFVAAGILREWVKGTASRRKKGQSYPSGIPWTDCIQPSAIRGLHRAPSSRCPCPGGGRVFPLRRPARRHPGARRIRGRRRLQDRIHGDADPGTIRQNRVSQRPASIPGQRRAQANDGVARLLSGSEYSRHQGSHQIDAYRRPIHRLQRIIRRRQGCFQNTGQPPGLVDVAGRANTCPRNNRCVVAAADLHHRQNAKAG